MSLGLISIATIATADLSTGAYARTPMAAHPPGCFSRALLRFPQANLLKIESPDCARIKGANLEWDSTLETIVGPPTPKRVQRSPARERDSTKWPHFIRAKNT